MRVVVFIFLPEYCNLAIVRRNCPGKDFDQCRFSGAVFADDAMRLSRVQRKVHIAQHRYAGIAFRDIRQVENQFFTAHIFLLIQKKKLPRIRFSRVADQLIIHKISLIQKGLKCAA
ncbi:hypothetical protein SDC9_112948 [bioreactor metagenome]|uniref:Uncharacterized protein n=1 Tax=bioreactor metagenome TaxID=1076179 RepID=A0A645BW86_9ZZZZ